LPLVGASREHKNALKSRHTDRLKDRQKKKIKIKKKTKTKRNENDRKNGKNQANIKLIPKRD